MRPTNVLLLLGLPALWPAVAAHLPVRHWTVDLAACFVVQAAAWLWLCTAALLLARRRRAALPLAVGALLATAAAWPGFAAAPTAPPGAAPLRLLALNLLRGNHARAGAALAEVAARDPDVVFAAEVTPEWQVALDAGLGGYPHRLHRADPGYFGVALWSRLPLQGAEILPLGYAWAPAIRAAVTTPNGPVGLLGIHPPRPGTGGRCAERDRALAAIPAALQPLPPARVVLGDANCTPWNGAFAELLASTGLARAGRGFWPTWPMQLPWVCRVPIDHVLVGGGVGVAELAVGAEFGSDHAPVFAVVGVPRANGG